MSVRTRWKVTFTFLVLLALALATAGTALAQEGDDGGEEEPSPFEHPVAAVFRSYFGDEVADELMLYHPWDGPESDDDEVDDGEEDNDADNDEEDGDETGKIGYGVLVKLYAMAAESEEACGETEEPCGVSVEELVAAYRSGAGMGELFQEYGRPSVLGVGHMRHDGETGPPDHAGPKDEVEDGDGQGGPPDDVGPPDHAGPKEKPDRDEGHKGPPDHAGPKK